MSTVRFLFWTIPITLIVIGLGIALWKQGGGGGPGLDVMDLINGAFGFLGAALRLGVDIINFIREMVRA